MRHMITDAPLRGQLPPRKVGQNQFSRVVDIPSMPLRNGVDVGKCACYDAWSFIVRHEVALFCQNLVCNRSFPRSGPVKLVGHVQVLLADARHQLPCLLG